MALIFILLVGSFNLHAQDPVGPRLTTDLEIGGRRVRVIDEDPYSARREVVTDSHGRRHTVRAYGSMWITFMASMIATELIFCSNQMLPWIANNEETPNCRDELSTMLQDPGMSLGILAMTFTSIELHRRGDVLLKRFTRKVLERHTGIVGRGAVALSQTLLEHLSMGAGMIVQTSIASTYNSPYMRECWSDIRKNISNTKKSNSTPSDDAISAAVDGAQAGENCSKAREYFFNAENGTMSEIYITVISIGASSIIAGALVSTIRLAGMFFMRFTPTGAAATTAGLILANPVIDVIDRYLEPIIRKAYHMRRSKRQLSFSFSKLIDSLDAYKSDGQLFQNYTRQTTCLEEASDTPTFVDGMYSEGINCVRWATEKVESSKILDALKTHKYNIDYRRRANLNRFTEAQARWQQKVSSLFSNLSVYQAMVRNLFSVRDTIKSDSSLKTTDYLSVVSRSQNPNEFFSKLQPSSNSRVFSKQQTTVLYPLMNSLRNRIKNNSYDQNIEIRHLIEHLNVAIHKNDKVKAHAILWALKRAFSPSYLKRYAHSNYVLVGTDFNQKEIAEVNRVITSMITSFTPASALAYQQFAINQIEFLNPYEEGVSAADSEPIVDAQQAARKGVQLQQNDPLTSLLFVNKDDAYPHADEKSFWSNSDNRGIVSKTVPGRILSHMACGDFQDMHFFYNDGHEARTVFPNVLKDSKKINCSVSRKASHFPLLNGYNPAYDFWPNPAATTVSYVLPDPSLNDIYQYNGVERVGLLEILVDPKTELRWANQDEFDKYWKSHFWPQVSEFLLVLKAEYFVTLSDFFQMNIGCNQGFFAGLFSDKSYCNSGYNLSTPLTDTEVQARNAGYFNSTDKSYYSTIGLAESFLDELRTYAFIIEKVASTSDPDKAQLLALMPMMQELVQNLDISKRDFNFEVDKLSPQKRQEMLTVEGIYQVLGDQAANNFGMQYDAVQTMVQERIRAFEAQGLTLALLNANDPAQLRSFSAADVVKLQIYSNLDSSLSYLWKNLLEDYLGGNNIIYIGNN